jgi:hypothetical protein
MTSTISVYSNACWGSQIGNEVAEGTLLPLFKFQSMNGGIVFRNGGPIGWLGERQEHTSLSSCEAEICATSTTSKKVIDFRNLCRSISDSSLPVPDASSPIVLYNNNDACIRWYHNMTLKAARHIELHENSVREWVQDKTLKVIHVASKTNPADIFTKEMRDGTHFWRLRDSFMSRLLDFLSASVLAVHHARQHSSRSMAPAAACMSLSSGDSPFMSVLASSSFFRTVSNISHLSSAGRHLLGELMASSLHLFCDILPSIYPWESSPIFPFAVTLGIYSDGATMSFASVPVRKIVQCTSMQFP